MQGRKAVPLRFKDIRVCSGVQQKFDHFFYIGSGCQHMKQRSEPISFAQVYVGSRIQEYSHHIGIRVRHK